MGKTTTGTAVETTVDRTTVGTAVGITVGKITTGTAVLILATVGSGVDAPMELQEANKKQKSKAVKLNDFFVDFTMMLPYVNNVIKKNTQQTRHD